LVVSGRGPGLLARVLGTILNLLLCASLPAGAARSQNPPTAAQPSFSTQPFIFEELRQRSRFDDNGTGRNEVFMRVRIQNDAGVQHWGQLTFPYAPGTQDLKVNVFEVRKPDGKVVRGDQAAIQDVAAQPQAGANVFQDFRQKHLTVPALKPGDVLVVALLWTIHTPTAPGHFFIQHGFTTDAIVLDERLEVDVPASRTLTIAVTPGSPGEEAQLRGTVRNGRRIYRWRTRQMSPSGSSPEKASHSAEPQPPAVRLSTFASWADVARWYSGLAAPAARVDAQIRARTESVTKGLTSEEDKIRALYEYVSSEIRYVSLSFGTGRYAPHPAPAVLANQYGDCKDKHTLLAAMLNAAGLEAWPVLANASRPVDPRMPSPLEFDHVLTVVPRGAGPQDWVWLDTTPGVAPYRMLTANLRNKDVLVVPPRAALAKAPDASRLVKTPAELPFRTATTFEIDGRINALGVLEGRVRQSLRGDGELLLRAVLRGVPEDKWIDIARGSAEGFGFKDSRVTDAKIVNLSATREPLIMEYSVRDSGHFRWTKTGATLALPMAPFTFVAETAKEWEGKKQLELGAPATVTLRASLQLPAGYKAAAPIGVTLARDAFDYESSYKLGDGHLRLERTLRTRVAELPVAAADEYIAFVRGVRADEAQPIPVEFETQGVPEIPADATPAELYGVGNAAYDRNNYEAAAAFFKRTVEIDPKHGNGWNALGLAYERLNRPKEAAEALRKQVEISPFHAQAHKDLARVLDAANELDDARTALLKHVEIHPLDGRALGDLGSLLVRMNRAEEALPHLEKATTLVKNDAWFFARLGAAYLDRKAPDKALAAFDEAVRLSPTPAIWTYTAWQRAEHGQDLDRAAELAERTLARAGEMMQKVRVDAIDARQRDVAERVGWSWDALGWIYFQNGDLPAAERYLKSAWMLSGEPAMVYHLAQLYEKQNQNVDAAGPGGRGIAVQERMVRLPIPDAGGFGDARFHAVLNPDGSVSEVSFASGDEKLRRHGQVLTKVRFPFQFPDKLIPRLAAGIRVQCAATGEGCFAVAELPRSPQRPF
jgi:tetratricopeptide (TPR) repeat protein